MQPPFDQAFWDDLYSAQETIWSGRPNPNLVVEAADLAPGSALDVGSGEGSDAVWLAARGWQVTAVDLSEIALARAAARVQREQDDAQDPTAPLLETASRISWQHRDILQWSPAARAFDLVTSQYSHFETSDMHALVVRLAEAVAVGGHLLVAGHEDHGHRHAPGDEEHEGVGMGPAFFYTPDELVGLLDPDDWQIVVAEFRPHPAREGRDTVLHARRRR